MEHVLITGSNRGVGLALVRYYLQQGDRVFATCRQPLEAVELQALVSEYPDHLTILALDVNDDASIVEAMSAVREQTIGIDLLINNAGINGTHGTRGIKTITRQAILEMVDVNAVSAIFVTRECHDLLTRGKNPRVVMISSQMGSLNFVRSGNNYGYSMSKAALNMASRVLSAELKAEGITVVTTHPGWVRTDMGGVSGQLAPEESASGLAHLFAHLTMEDTGKFYKWNGDLHDW